MSEEQKTAEDRAKDFIKEYGELVQKHQIDFATFPTFVPNGKGGFEITVQSRPIDITPQPVPSPLVTEG